MRFQAALAIVGLAVSVCACGGAGPTAPVVPATAGDLKSSLSTSFDALTVPANTACSISISQHGHVLLERGRGQIAPGRQAAVDSLYRIASLTKPITASAVLISEQAGRLSRTDTIGRFLAYPEPAPTIDELIKHIPGLSNYTSTPAYLSGNTSPTTLESLLSLIQLSRIRISRLSIPFAYASVMGPSRGWRDIDRRRSESFQSGPLEQPLWVRRGREL